MMVPKLSQQHGAYTYRLDRSVRAAILYYAFPLDLTPGMPSP